MLSDAELANTLARVDQVERLLLAVEGITETMALRAELRGMQRPLSRRGEHRFIKAMKRICAVRRVAEDIVGGFILSLGERGLRCGGSHDRKIRPTREAFGVPIGCWKRWQKRARLADAKLFAVRLAEADTVAAVKGLLSEAGKHEARARYRRDDRALALRHAMKAAAMRAAGSAWPLAYFRGLVLGNKGAPVSQLSRLPKIDSGCPIRLLTVRRRDKLCPQPPAASKRQWGTPRVGRLIGGLSFHPNGRRDAVPG